MGSVVCALEHTYSEGCADRCGKCVECCLSVCTVCDQCEGGLTTHCPGSIEEATAHDAYTEAWDFRHGEWVPGVWSRRRHWKPAFAIYNELRYLEYLQKDALGNREKTLETLTYLKEHFCPEFVEGLVWVADKDDLFEHTANVLNIKGHRLGFST